ncbi:MAG: membrane protein insertase YidC, partial [bacterium]
MKSQHRILLAVALSAAFFILWHTVISPPKKEATPPPAAQSAQAETGQATPTPQATAPAAAAAKPAAANDPQARIPVAFATIKNELIEVDVTNDGGTVTSWRAKEYRQTPDAASPPTDLAMSEPGLPAPLALSLDGAALGVPDNPRFEIVETGDSRVVLRWTSPKIELTKTISLQPMSYVADVAVDVKNRSSEPITVRPALEWSGVNQPQKKGGFFSFLKGQQADIKQPVYFIDGKARRATDVQKLVRPASFTGSVYWAGIESRYFLSAVIPRMQGEGLAAEYGNAGQPADAQSPQGLWAGVALPSTAIPAGETAKSAFSVYAGPKEMSQLKTLGVRLEEAIDYGWFTVIAVPILYLLRFFYKIINNYGIAIILLTIFVKLLLHPINVRSLKSMKAMQQLQPRLKELQQKFKDDKQKLN